jgi:hypothetical protein
MQIQDSSDTLFWEFDSAIINFGLIISTQIQYHFFLVIVRSRRIGCKFIYLRNERQCFPYVYVFL